MCRHIKSNHQMVEGLEIYLKIQWIHKMHNLIKHNLFASCKVQCSRNVLLYLFESAIKHYLETEESGIYK